MESEQCKIVKLTSAEGWQMYKFQVKVALNANELYEIVSGKKVKPTLQVGEKDQEFQTRLKGWFKNDYKAQNLIVSSLGQQPTLYVMNCNTSKEIWDKLESVYERSNNSSILLLQQRFYALTKNLEDDIATYISKLMNVFNQLKEQGEEIASSMLISKILMTLPPEYNHFTSAWESTIKSEQTLENLTARLLTEEVRITAGAGSSSEAFVVNKNSLKKFSEKKMLFL